MKSVATGVIADQMKDIGVYPNPVKNVLHFKQKVNAVTIANIAGQTILQKYEVTSVDMSNLKTGLYFVKIAEGDNLIVKKVLKQ
jgi:hypothetical protein